MVSLMEIIVIEIKHFFSIKLKLKDKMDDANFGDNRVCAEVVFSKSPHSFWVRLSDSTNDFNEMIARLQVEYENANES